MSATPSVTAHRTPLPGTPGPTLAVLWGALSPEEQHAALPHLLGDTSADWLADLFRFAGHQISASTIRTYRRALRQIGGTL